MSERARSWSTVVAALVAGAMLVVADATLPRINLGPLNVLPAIALAVAGRFRLACGFSVLLAAGSGIGEPYSEHQPLDQAALLNALIFLTEYLVAIGIIAVALRQRERYDALSLRVDDAVQSAVRTFNADEPSGLGWSVAVTRADASCAASAHDVRRRGDGYDLFVTEVVPHGVESAMVLSAVRSVFPVMYGLDPRARLATQNEHLRPVCAGGLECRAFDARLSSVGAVRFASAGFAPAIAVRRSGAIELIGGGGGALGRSAASYVVEGLVVLDEGDALVVLDDRMRQLVHGDRAVLDRLVAGDPSLRDDLVARHGEEIGLGIVARRVVKKTPRERLPVVSHDAGVVPHPAE